MGKELSKGRVTQKPGADVVDNLTSDGYQLIKKDLSSLSEAEQMDVVYRYDIFFVSVALNSLNLLQQSAVWFVVRIIDLQFVLKSLHLVYFLFLINIIDSVILKLGSMHVHMMCTSIINSKG